MSNFVEVVEIKNISNNVEITELNTEIIEIAKRGLPGEAATISGAVLTGLNSLTGNVNIVGDAEINVQTNAQNIELSLVNDYALSSELQEVSGNLYSLIQDTSGSDGTLIHNDLTGIQGGETGEYYHLTEAQFNDYVGKTEVANLTGSLQSQITSNDNDITQNSSDISQNASNIAANFALIQSVSGASDTNLINGTGTNVVEAPADTWQVNIVDYISKSEVENVSGSLQSQITNNDNDISQNTSDISQNATNIASNFALIQSVSGDLANLDAVDISIDNTNLNVAHGNNVQEYIESNDIALLNARSTGIRFGGELTDMSGGNVRIAPGAGQVLDNADPENPTYSSIEWQQSDINLGSQGDGIYYIYIDSSGTIFFTTTEPENPDYRDSIWLHRVAIIGGEVFGSTPIPNPSQQIGGAVWDVWDALGFIKDGLTLSPNGANLAFQHSAGYIFTKGANYYNNPKDPNRLQFNVTNPVSFTHALQTGPTGSLITELDVTNYDNGGVLTAIPGANRRAQIFTIAVFPGGPNYFVLYGQQFYNNTSQALEALEADEYNPILPVDWSDNALILGYIITRKDATDLNDADNFFVSTNKFGLIGGGISSAGINALLAVNNLSDLTDVVEARTNLEVISETESAAISAGLDGRITSNADDITALQNESKVNSVNTLSGAIEITGQNGVEVYQIDSSTLGISAEIQSGEFVSKAGDTMTGDLTIDTLAGDANQIVTLDANGKLIASGDKVYNNLTQDKTLINPSYHWEFTGTDNDWIIAGGTQNISANFIELNSTTNDMNFRIQNQGNQFDADKNKFLTITYSTDTTIASNIQIFSQKSGGAFNFVDSTSFALRNTNGAWATKIIDLREQSNWDGLLSGFRIDMLNPNIGQTIKIAQITMGRVGIGANDIYWDVLATGTNQAYNQRGYILNGSSNAVTLTLPLAPNVGDTVWAMCTDATNTITIDRNGENIIGVAEDFTIDGAGTGVQLVYTGATFGWSLASEVNTVNGQPLEYVTAVNDASTDNQIPTAAAVYSYGQSIAGADGVRCMFYAKSNSGQTVGNTRKTIIFEDEVFDIDNNYNTSTGIFTAPEDGYYFFSGRITFKNGVHTVDNRCYIEIERNGTAIYSDYWRAITTSSSSYTLVALQVTGLTFLNAGDTVNCDSAESLSGVTGLTTLDSYNTFYGYGPIATR